MPLARNRTPYLDSGRKRTRVDRKTIASLKTTRRTTTSLKTTRRTTTSLKTTRRTTTSLKTTRRTTTSLKTTRDMVTRGTRRRRSTKGRAMGRTIPPLPPAAVRMNIRRITDSAVWTSFWGQFNCYSTVSLCSVEP